MGNVHNMNPDQFVSGRIHHVNPYPHQIKQILSTDNKTKPKFDGNQ